MPDPFKDDTRSVRNAAKSEGADEEASMFLLVEVWANKIGLRFRLCAAAAELFARPLSLLLHARGLVDLRVGPLSLTRLRPRRTVCRIDTAVN